MPVQNQPGLSRKKLRQSKLSLPQPTKMNLKGVTHKEISFLKEKLNQLKAQLHNATKLLIILI